MTDHGTAHCTNADLLGKINAALLAREQSQRERDERRRALMQRYPNATAVDLFGLATRGSR